MKAAVADYVRRVVDEEGLKGSFVGKRFVWSLYDELEEQGIKTSVDEVISALRRAGVDVAWEWEG